MSHVIFKWLHLSDIHFSEKAGFNTKSLRTLLPKYLKTVLKERYDCMVLSGDFRYAPDNKMDTKEIVQYIHKLLDSTELSKDRIITTPGNHDLIRTEYRKIDIKNAKKGYKPTSGSFKDCYLAKLKSAFTFYNQLRTEIDNNNKIISIENNPHYIVDIKDCYLLVLNTALLAYGGKGDKNKLLVGSNYLLALIEEIRDKPKPIIAVGHHGLEWFDETEKNTLLTWFKQEGIKLYLCGHSHQFRSELFDGGLYQITTGCIINNDEQNVDAAFSIGQLYSDGKVSIDYHQWSLKYKQWVKENTPPDFSVFNDLYKLPKTYVIEPEKRRIEKTNYPFTISKVMSNSDGVKYIWEKGGSFVESITINSIESDEDTSVYIISTSIGCLSSTNCQNTPCETGKNGLFIPLTAEDIALQCIFMALYDINYCKNHPEVQVHKREFAFQSQGDPEYHLDAVKKAILLNDIVMEKLDQNVSKYVISTHCEIQALPFSDYGNALEAGDSTIRAFNAAVRELDTAKKTYDKAFKNQSIEQNNNTQHKGIQTYPIRSIR